MFNTIISSFDKPKFVKLSTEQSNINLLSNLS